MNEFRAGAIAGWLIAGVAGLIGLDVNLFVAAFILLLLDLAFGD
jgi:hypothetical protein